MKTVYRAPWCLTLKVVSALVTIGMLAIAITVLAQADIKRAEMLLVAGVSLLIPGIAVWFLTRGYELRDGNLLIRRLGWTSMIDLEGLLSAEADPDAMKGSIRLCGNGGLFAIAGLMRSKKLGNYRAWVTDPKNSVLLKWGERTIVISPEEPEVFAVTVKELKGL